MKSNRKLFQRFRTKLFIIIFGTDTRLGKLFDLVLLYFILGSITVVILESVPEYQERFGSWFFICEWMFTVFFTIEYALRLFSSKTPKKYAKSFLGIIDLIAILPTYLTLFSIEGQYLLVVRAIRLLRVFRILKLTRQIKAAQILAKALFASRFKIMVFMGTVLASVLIMGTLMYMIEGAAHGFTSIPKSIYWAIVTITTVGYGDISPATPLGQLVASILMLMGYAIIAVPTGIVTAELALAEKEYVQEEKEINSLTCSTCLSKGHLINAFYCWKCGAKLDDNETTS